MVSSCLRVSEVSSGLMMGLPRDRGTRSLLPSRRPDDAVGRAWVEVDGGAGSSARVR